MSEVRTKILIIAVVFRFPLGQPGTNEFFLVVSLVGEVSSETQPSEAVSLTALIVEPNHRAILRVNVVLAEVFFDDWVHPLATVGVGKPLHFFWLEVGHLVDDLEFL